MVPSGNSGNWFIENLTDLKLFTAYAQESSHESFTIKAAMMMDASPSAPKTLFQV